MKTFLLLLIVAAVGVAVVDLMFWPDTEGQHPSKTHLMTDDYLGAAPFGPGAIAETQVDSCWLVTHVWNGSGVVIEQRADLIVMGWDDYRGCYAVRAKQPSETRRATMRAVEEIPAKTRGMACVEP